MEALQTITKDWIIAEIVLQYPQCTEVLAEWGLHCYACSIGTVETLEEGCLGHGFSEEDLNSMLDDINDAIENNVAKPQMINVTKESALQIREIAKENKSEDQGLSIQAQKDGSFFMEFRKRYEKGEKEFFAREVPDVKVWASPLTLQRIGGSTIDYREGRFKLDMI
jgi:hybrid cluster-associated redox disulfide protein